MRSVLSMCSMTTYKQVPSGTCFGAWTTAAARQTKLQKGMPPKRTWESGERQVWVDVCFHEGPPIVVLNVAMPLHTQRIPA